MYARAYVFQDVNFWGSVYPTYYALPHLKASKGKLIVCSSAAGTVATSRMAFYNVRNQSFFFSQHYFSASASA
jgi:NADP-dependent 3-hydroxy acid dehydrogenase YdfG